MKERFAVVILMLLAVSTSLVAQNKKQDIDCFVRATLRPAEITEGDSAVVTYTFYSSVPASQVELKSVPKGKNACLRQLRFNANATRQRVVSNGKWYYAVTAAQYVVVPDEDKATARITTCEFTATFRFRKSSGDPFEDFWGGGETYEVKASAKSDQIEIKTKEKRRRTMQEILPEGLI